MDNVKNDAYYVKRLKGHADIFLDRYAYTPSII